MGKKAPIEIDYVEIIDNLSDSAFEFSKSYIYNKCEYKILDIEDVRRIDLEEWFLNFIERAIPRQNDQGSYDFYLNILESFFAKVFKFEKDSINEKYKIIAVEKIQIARTSFSLSILNDLFLIFTMFLRPHKGDMKKIGKNKTSDSIDFTLYKEDINLYYEIKEKQINFENIYEGVKLHEVIKSSKEPDVFFLVTNILLLSYGLDVIGFFHKRN